MIEDGRLKRYAVSTTDAIVLGRPARGHLLLTKTLLIVGQEGNTHRPRQGDRQGRGGGLAARNATGAPMTYMLDGKQFIVVPTGGANLPAELIAMSLP